jgi:hypothetical protein
MYALPAVSAIQDLDKHATAQAPSAPRVEDSTERVSTPALITEQEVVFSTAAAVALPSPTTTRRFSDRLRSVATNVLVFLTPAPRPRPARRHVPARRYPSYFESSLESRERLRL